MGLQAAKTLNKPRDGRGGYRPNAGRKADPAKDLKTGALTAQRILKDLREEVELKTLYKTCKDARLRTYIIMRLREWAYGKAPQSIEHSGRVGVEHELREMSDAELQQKLKALHAQAAALIK